jgi:hypothetical protein
MFAGASGSDNSFYCWIVEAVIWISSCSSSVLCGAVVAVLGWASSVVLGWEVDQHVTDLVAEFHFPPGYTTSLFLRWESAPRQYSHSQSGCVSGHNFVCTLAFALGNPSAVDAAPHLPICSRYSSAPRLFNLRHIWSKFLGRFNHEFSLLQLQLPGTMLLQIVKPVCLS